MMTQIVEEQPNFWLRRVSLTIRPWFAEFGDTLDDVISFRHFIEEAEADVAEWEPFVEIYRKHDLEIEAAEIEAEIAEARELVFAMRNRLFVLIEERRKEGRPL